MGFVIFIRKIKFFNGKGTFGMILTGKKILVTGVVTKQSIAYYIAKKIQEQGGEVILTGGPGKSCRLTERVAMTLDPVPPVVQMDVTDDAQVAQVVDFVKEKWGTLDGLLHSIAFAPSSCLGMDFAKVPWEDVSAALRISSYSLAQLGAAFAPLMKNGSIVALDFDATVVWAYYNWMGVCKAALESISRYLARDLGLEYNIRVNCLSAGPLKTVAAKAIPAFTTFEKVWEDRSILNWDLDKDAAAVADTSVFLFSDLSSKITGEMIHVDGGYHIMGSPPAKEEAIEPEMEKV